MTSRYPRTISILRIFQILFYAAFVFLWFKDNFPKFRPIHVSPLIPLAGLIIVTLLRAGLKYRAPRLQRQPVDKRDVIAVALIILAATAVHLPLLLHAEGLMDSDEAIPALQGKHIAEGRVPALFYYGARFQGSLPQHYYALLFRAFGFSVFLVKFAAYLAFTGFLAVQYVLLKRVFSRETAILAGAFYVLPFPNLLLASFDVGSGFAVLFLMGSVILLLTAEIAERGREGLIAPLGFLLGLAFWTHQVAIVFVLTSGIVLIIRFRFRLQKYLVLAGYAALGLLPVIISEFYWGFLLVRWLFSGGESTAVISGGKIANGKRLFLELFSSGPGWANAIYLVLAAAGLVGLAVPLIRKKKFPMSSLFAVYILVYAAVYFISSFSATGIIRYLYILYLAIPLLFLSALSWIKSRGVRVAAAVILFAAVFLGSNARTAADYYRSTASRDRGLKAVSAAMIATGEKYWQGHYWISYLLDAVAKERVIVASSTVVRYPYYVLMRDTESERTNMVFLRDTPEQTAQAAEVVNELGRLKKSYKTEILGEWVLVYGIAGPVYSKNIYFPPEEVPDVALVDVQAKAAGLELHFASNKTISSGGFRIFAEIDGFCRLFAPIDPGTRFSLRIPYPSDRKARIRYFLDFQGLYLESTLHEDAVDIPLPPPGTKREILEPLWGFGPREKNAGNNWLSLERDVAFRVNKSPGSAPKIGLKLFSPFNFRDPFWHGRFEQAAEIVVNGQFVKTVPLPDGPNTVMLDAGQAPFREGANIVRLKFRYAMVISLKQDHWKTAVYLEEANVN